MLGYIGEDESSAWASFTLAGRLLRCFRNLINPSFVSNTGITYFVVSSNEVWNGMWIALWSAL